MRKYFNLLTSEDSDKSEVLQSDVFFLMWFLIMIFCICLCLSVALRYYRRRRLLQGQNMQGQYSAYPQAQYQAVPSQPRSQQQYYSPQQAPSAPNSGHSQHFVPFQSTGHRLGGNEPTYNPQVQYAPPPPPPHSYNYNQ